MFNYDYSLPGPSRYSFNNNDGYNNYDYSSRNSNPPNLTLDRARSSHRGARQGFNVKNQNQNRNMNAYSQSQRVASQDYYKKHSPQKKRDKDRNQHSLQQLHKNNKSSNFSGENSKHNSKILTKEIDYRLYKCPNCSLQFDWLSRYNSYSYTGRVPLILNCKHTVCQECIYKLSKDNSVICPVCQDPSAVPSKCTIDDLQDIFSPNFFLIGFILWCKTQGNNPNFMSLVPVQTKSVTKSITQALNALPTIQQSAETCCFLSCSKIATLNCEECNDVYCSDCCTAVHKSAKSLWFHKQLPLAENKQKTLELEKCTEHNMHIEFYCTTCKTEVCCYCFLEQHESHGKENVTRLNQEEMQELQTNKENTKKLLKQLLISQRRLKDLYNCSTNNIEKKISDFFVNYHAKLQYIEKTLKKEITGYSMDGKILDDAKTLNSSLASTIETLSNIVVSCDSVEHRKMNLKEMSKRLKSVQNIPTYLLCDSGNRLEPLEFTVDPITDRIEEFFKIERSNICDVRLVTEDELPSDYEKDAIDQLYESDAESCLSSLSKSVTTEERKQKKKNVSKFVGANQVPLENEMVEVTHIESLECFYVQLKRMQYQFSQMNRDIVDYIKMGAPEAEEPQLNELYLALYQIKNEKIWCRGRITGIKKSEAEPMYEVFFIDYGSTQTIDASKLRQITPSLAQKKPFAIHCELYNPSLATWSKNAHVYMAKMLNGKRVTMLVKGVHSGIHEVDLMITSSDRGQTSIIDVLIHTCNVALSNSDNDNESVSSTNKFYFNPGYKIFGNSSVFHKFQEEKVIIVNVIDPHHIFVHMVTHAESLKKMNALLKTTYKHSRKNSCLPVEGSYVIIDYKDPIRGNWHRGLIKKVDINSEKCHVLLVDWGLNVTVAWTNIRMIQEEFTRLESQAILVKLAHVEPFDKGAWMDAANIFLQKYFRLQETMRMVVHNTDPLEVALFEIVGDVDICVNATLVAENFAESTGKISQTLEWPRNNPDESSFSENGSLVETLLKKVNEAVGEESEEEDDKGLVRQPIEVVKFVSPDLIYIKFSKYEEQEMNLNKELQIHYSNERKTKTVWEPDELCVVMYKFSYVRAKILEKIDEKKYKVNIYDRAVEAELAVDKIFEYVKYFNKFPNVVFKSHLANIKPAGGNKWSLLSIEVLERMFEKYKEIYGTRVSGDTTGKSFPMHMWYTQVKVGGALEASITKFISLNNLLVKMGFAYKITSSKAGSVGSNKSTKSIKSSDSNSSGSTFISVLEKIARDSGTTLVESPTDSHSNVKGEESSHSITKDDGASLSSLNESSIASDKLNSVIDWNQMIEEEEKKEVEAKKIRLIGPKKLILPIGYLRFQSKKWYSMLG